MEYATDTLDTCALSDIRATILQDNPCSANLHLWKTNKTFPIARSTNTKPFGSLKNGSIALYASLSHVRHEPAALRNCWSVLEQFSHGNRMRSIQAISDNTFTTDIDMDNMDPAPLAGWMFEGDTQPLDSQLYREYDDVVTDADKEPYDTQLATGRVENRENESRSLKKEIQAIRDQKSPTPPGWLNDKGRREIDDELSGAPNLPAIPPLKHQIYPTTPGTIGKKRDFRGEIVTPATETPGSALTAQFNANVLKSMGAANPAVSLSQIFADTQAQSSPVANDLKSDPIFQRPSPNFNQGPLDSPADIQSSPTKAIHSISPDALDAVKGAYTTMKESQLQREQKETRSYGPHLNGQSNFAFGDVPEAQEDSLHNIITIAEERMLRDRRHAQKRHNALISCKNLHAPKRPQAIRKPRKSKTVSNKSDSPTQTQHNSLHQFPVSHDDSFSFLDIDSIGELNENNANHVEASEQQVLAFHNKSSGDIKSGGEDPTPKFVAGQVQNVFQSRNLQNIAEQRPTSQPSRDEKGISGSERGEINLMSIHGSDRLQRRDSTILIPQSQPAIKEADQTTTRREDKINSISPRKNNLNLTRDRSTMSSSPPLVQGYGQSEERITYQQKREKQVPNFGSGTHIDGKIPCQASSPLYHKIPLNNSDKSTPMTAKQQYESQNEEPIEVPETDPPEYMSSHRSTCRQLKAIDSNNIPNSPLHTLPQTSELIPQAARDRDRYTGSTHYETAPSKFSVISHPASRTQESRMPQLLSSNQNIPSQGHRQSINALFDLEVHSTTKDSSNLFHIASQSSPIPAGKRRSGRIIQKHGVSSSFSVVSTKATSSFDAAVYIGGNNKTDSKVTLAAKAYSFPKASSQPSNSILSANSKDSYRNTDPVQGGSKSEAIEPLLNAEISTSMKKLHNDEEELARSSNADCTTKNSYSKWFPESAYAPRRVLALFKDRSHYYWPATSLGRVNRSNPVYRIRFDDGAVDDIEAKHVCIFNLVPGDSVKVDIPTLKKNIYVIRDFERNGTLASPKDCDENVPTDIHGHEMVKVAVKGRHSSTDHCTSVPLSSIYLTGTMWPHYKDRLLSMDTAEGHGHSFRCLTPKTNLSVPGSPSSRTRRTTLHTPIKRDKPVSSSELGENASRLFAGMAFVISSSEEEVKRTSLISILSKNGATVLDDDFDSLFSLNESQRRSFSSLHTSESSEVKDLNDLTLSSKAEEYGFTALLAHEFSRRVKHMQALALGLPVLHSRWVNDCIEAQVILPWKHYVLPAGKSTLLDGAIVSRTISTYDASTAKLKDILAKRDLVLPGERVIMVESSGNKRNESGKARGKRGEENGDRQRKYAFLTCAMGAAAICRVKDLAEAKKVLQEESKWTQVHIDGSTDGARRILLSNNHRETNTVNKIDTSPAKVVITNREEVIQSLILGKTMTKSY